MGDRNESQSPNGAPEPPKRWKPDSNHMNTEPSPDRTSDDDTSVGAFGAMRIELKGSEIPMFVSARRLITASQICAIVSFFIGGVLLSSVAVVCALIAHRKLCSIALNKADSPDVQRALRRVGIMAIGLAVVALVVNIAALVLLYPVAMQALQSSDMGSLFAGPNAAGGTAGNSTWG